MALRGRAAQKTPSVIVYGAITPIAAMIRPAPAIEMFFMNCAMLDRLVWGSVSSQKRCMRNAISSTRIASQQPGEVHPDAEHDREAAEEHRHPAHLHGELRVDGTFL